MSDERVSSKMVTTFLLDTCRLRPQLNEHAVQAALHCARIATQYAIRKIGYDLEADLIPMTSGSVASGSNGPISYSMVDLFIRFVGLNITKY